MCAYVHAHATVSVTEYDCCGVQQSPLARHEHDNAHGMAVLPCLKSAASHEAAGAGYNRAVACWMPAVHHSGCRMHVPQWLSHKHDCCVMWPRMMSHELLGGCAATTATCKHQAPAPMSIEWTASHGKNSPARPSQAPPLFANGAVPACESVTDRYAVAGCCVDTCSCG